MDDDNNDDGGIQSNKQKLIDSIRFSIVWLLNFVRCCYVRFIIASIDLSRNTHQNHLSV